MNKILVIEDDPSIRELLEYNLEQASFKVQVAEDGNKGLEIIQSKWPDLIVLDLMLPGVDGLEICKRVRNDKNLSHTLIIMLTAKGEEIDRVLGLEIGADDYVTKPFSTRELIARIKGMLRRTAKVKVQEDNMLIRGSLKIDLEAYEVYIDETKIELTSKEFKLISLLASNPGKVFTREYILERIWGYEYLGDTRTVDVHIRHIRQKIGENLIETVRGVGYKYKE